VGHDAQADRVCAALAALGCDASVAAVDDLPHASAIAGVVDLRALEAPSADALSGADMQRTAERLSSGLLRLVQSLAQAVPGECRLVIVTRGAIAASGEPVAGLVQSPLWGIGKVVALEHPTLRTTLVDIDTATDTATAVVDGLGRASSETQVVVREGRVSSPRLRPYRSPQAGAATRVAPVFAPDAAYVVTGGFGGLGLLVAEWLATKGAGCVVLVGRRAPSGDAALAIRALEARGTRVVARQADVADVDRITAVLDDVRCTGIRIAGVFHAAGILDDGILLQLDDARLAQALAPKVQGTWNLHLATAGDRLDHFVLFSAATSLFGSAGQASHAAANAFLDAFAAYRRATGQPALSINWGAWEEIGKAAGTDVARRVRMKGLRGIEPARGLAILDRLLQNGPAQVGVFSVDWQAIPAAMKALPFLEDCVAASATSPGAAAPAPTVSFAAEFASAPAQRKRSLLAEQVRTDIRRVLGLHETTVIDMKQGLFELGVDSLTSMELRDRLQANCGCALPSTLVFDYPTPDAIVSHILPLMGGSTVSTAATAPAAVAASPAVEGVAVESNAVESAAEQLQRKLAELRQALGS
jgi:NAD(P)-dependent dehydrogenase (short-subunit alcohol dehydrogenase family)/acyl carrier protein